jgi:hypothetical protein
VPASGKIAFDMYGNDWKLPAGHRLGVLVSSSHSEWWAHVPTGQTVTVKSASLAVPYLGCQRTDRIQGDPSVKLEDYVKSAPFAVDADTVKAGTDPAFPVPDALHKCAGAETAGGPAAGCVDSRKFAFRIHQPKRGRIVRAVAYVNGKRKASAKARKGKAVKAITVKRLPANKTFTLKVVATHSDGKQTVSVRKYRGCKKGRPKTKVKNPR